MACSITITSVNAVGTPGQNPDVTVRGTVSGCAGEVVVRYICHSDPGDPSIPGVPFLEARPQPDLSGQWQASFSKSVLNQLPCGKCGDTVSIAAYCSTDPSCNDVYSSRQLPCNPPPTPCPTPTTPTATVDPDPCRPDGKRNVHITATIQNPSGSQFGAAVYLNETVGGTQWVVKNPIVSRQTSHAISETYPVTGDSKKSYEAEVGITSPLNCPSKKSPPFQVKDCPKCPQVKNLKKKNTLECETDGSVKVGLTAEVTPRLQQDVDYYWEDGTYRSATKKIKAGQTPIPPADGELVYPRSETRRSGRVAKLVITSPAGCTVQDDVRYDLPDCDCPEVTIVTPPKISDCDADGKRKVEITVKVNPHNYPRVRFQLRAKATTAGATASDFGAAVEFKPGDPNPKVSDSLPPGKYDVTPKVTEPKGCATSGVEITLEPCEQGTALCPKLADFKFKPADCDASGKRTVEVSIEVTPQGPGEVEAKLRDLTDPAKPVVDSKKSTAAFTLKAPSGGAQKPGTRLEYEVEVTRPANCRGDAKKTGKYTVPDCPPLPKPYDPFSDFSCKVFRTLAMVSLAAAVVALLLIFCIPAATVGLLWTALALGIVGVIFLLIYWFVCPNKPCRWGWLVVGQALVGAGLGAAWFSGCCNLLFLLIAAGAFLLGVLVLALCWAVPCNLPACAVFSEIALVAMFFVPIVGALAFVPFLQSCINVGVGTLVNGFLVILGVSAGWVPCSKP